MAVRIKIGNRPLLNATSYSVQEDSTSINPSDENGGTSRIDFAVPTFPGWRNIEDQPIELRDDTQGVTAGTVTAVSEQNGLVQITADSRILQLAATRTALPYKGTLGGAFRYYFSLVGITTQIAIDNSIASIPVVFPGWRDDVYQRLAKSLCPAFGVELSLVSNNIVVRVPRQRKAILRRLVDFSESIDNGDRAQRSKLNWTKTTWTDRGLMYPTGGWNSDVEVFEVNSGEVKVYETVEVSASVTSVEQPTCLLNIGPEYDSNSVYAVTGNDSFPIPPAMWAAYGGDLRVDVNEDTRSLRVTIRGMDFPQYAPYKIAVSSDDGSDYSTLRIVGQGVILDPQVVDISTGLTADQASAEYSDEVENDFINAFDLANYAAMWQVSGATGPSQTISFTASGINRTDDNGSAAYPTTDDFDEEYAGRNSDDFDAIWYNQTTDDWDAYWNNKVSSDFANQAFGNVAGARIIHDSSIYRIRTATNTGGSIQGTAETDNTVDDFDTYYAGMTTDDWDAMWIGKTIKDFDVAPFPGIMTDGTRPRRGAHG